MNEIPHPSTRLDRPSFSSHSSYARSPLGGSADFRRRSSSRRTQASSSSGNRPILTSRPVTLWTHEPPNFSSHELVLNPDLIAAAGGISESSELFEVRLPENGSSANPLIGAPIEETRNGDGQPSATARGRRRGPRLRKQKGVVRRSFLFKASQAVGDLACIEKAGSQLQLSISRSIASVFGFYNRCEVILSKVPRAEHTISHVELYFRDQYVGRADMWRLSSLLEDTCVYVGQKVTLASCVRATVGRIFIDEKKVMSGYVGPQTRTVFRSESAKFNIFIQMATEMWDFDEDGELYYEKALSGFLPDLDRRWRNIPANHVVSVILFARVHYDESELHMLQEYELPLRQEEGGKRRWYIDYYKVLVDLESDCNWPITLTLLKEEFFRFRHDVLLLRRPVAGPAGAPWLEEQHADLLRRDRALLAGTLSSSHEGNILEAVNLALNPFDEHYIDRDLNRTGLNLLIITAGTGHFDVNKQLLRLTTERLIDNGIGLDLVCLTKMPLHSVPLFHFQSQVLVPEIFAGAGLGASRSSFGTQTKSSAPKKRRGTATGSRPPIEEDAPPDPLYFDPKHASFASPSASWGNNMLKASSLCDFYGIPHWVDCSFYNLQQDKPFRANRFVPRCKMHEVQMLGLMENEISDISIPYIDYGRIPGVVATAGCGSFTRSHNSIGQAQGYGSQNTKYSRSFSLAPEIFGDLANLHSREQRKIMREQYDREMFRDLENVPSTYRSWLVQQGPADRSSMILSSSPPPMRGSSLSSTGSRQVPTQEWPGQTKQDALLLAKRPSGGSYSRSPAKTRGLRTSLLVTTPRLESHDEHPTAMREDYAQQEGGDEFPSPTLNEQMHLSLMKSVDSLASLSIAAADEASPSRAGSVRSFGTLGRGFRPLEPLGKAKAFVAPSQIDFDFVKSPVEPENSEALDSPAKEKASSLLQVDRQEISPTKAKAGYRDWLWTSFRGSSKQKLPRKGVLKTNQEEEAVEIAPSAAEASRRIQSLLSASSNRKTASSTSSSRSSSPGGEKNIENHPGPISIPTTQSVKAASEHGRDGKGTTPTSDQQLQKEQEAYEQALEDEEAKIRYAEQAQVEKQTLVNPSNPQKSIKGTMTSTQLIRWQHLFPRRLNQHVVKWRSMTTPACLPLTTFYLPSESDLTKQWQEYPYQISISSDSTSFLVKRGSSTPPALAVLKEMASQRLAQGFQFVVPFEGSNGSLHDRALTAAHSTSSRRDFRLREPWDLFQPGTFASGNPIFLSMTNQIHRISYDNGTNSINVKRYVRRTDYDTNQFDYACCIWPRNLPGYQTVQSSFLYPDSGSYNWTYLDALIAGYAEGEEFGSATKYWRTRFVVVPSEGSPPVMKGSNEETLSDEEVRLMGMDRLADLFGRARWRPKKENTDQRRKGGQHRVINQISAAPLRFIPTSLDPAMSLRDDNFMKLVEAAQQEDNNEVDLRKPKPEKMPRTIEGKDFVELVREMYSPSTGLKIDDRLWNRIMYREAFSGADFVTWLCAEFSDVKSREEATEWGNYLLREGVLRHVHDYHGFLDGHYFYCLTARYLSYRPTQTQEKGWFAGSAASKPRGDMRSSSATSRESKGPEGKQESDKGTKKGSRRVLMSRSMIIDVDPGRKSDRAEVALLHYDTAHNPANGFNFQIHWLGTTARFIEDTVQSWTRSVERYGLRCIEAPIKQIKDVSQHNPFQAPLPIALALYPPPASMFARYLPAHADSQHYFQYSLLRKFGFILDQEASEKYQKISTDIEIEYKSRPSAFDLSQFVHRSGVSFVQVLPENEGFLWLDNRLFNSHLQQQQQQQQQQFEQQPHLSIRDGNRAGNGNHRHSSATLPSADLVRREFIDFCGDVIRLELFYRESLTELKLAWQEPSGEQGGVHIQSLLPSAK